MRAAEHPNTPSRRSDSNEQSSAQGCHPKRSEQGSTQGCHLERSEQSSAPGCHPERSERSERSRRIPRGDSQQSPCPTIRAQSILQKVRYGSEWFGVDYNMNLYRGCAHGCIYCDSRSECYRIDNFDQVHVKFDALAILRRELRSRRVRGVVGVGAMSDTYNPFERTLQVTRGALELIEEFGFGVSVDTKSTLITRDIDLLQAIGAHGGAIAKITITTADDDLSRLIEPHAPRPSERFAALSQLADAGIFCGVLFTPTLPWVTDDDATVRAVVEGAAAAGARFVYHTTGVTMRDRQRDHFLEHIAAVDPALPARYRETFGDRYFCNSPRATENRALFRALCKEHNLLWRISDIITTYKPTQPMGSQTSLF